MFTPRIPIAVVTVALLAAACGGGAGAPAPIGTPESTPAAQASPTPRTVTIAHAAGKTTITGVPTRVVVLEWTYAENLAAVGVAPAGVADIAGYKKWVNVESELIAKAEDVGTRQQPSLEAISRLGPDLIIGVAFRHKAILPTLQAIAPTLIFDPYPAQGGPDQFAEMQATFLSIADAVDRRVQAEAVLTKMRANFEANAKKIRNAKPVTDTFVLTQAFSGKDTPQIRVFLDNGMATRILVELGLRNAWTGPFDIYGFNTVGVEALTKVEQANFFYVVQNDDNVFATTLRENPVWKGLAFVKHGRTYPLGGDAWLFGGPISSQRVADKVASAFVR